MGCLEGKVGTEIRTKKESGSRFGKGNRHLTAVEESVVQAGHSSKTVLDAVELNQSHVLLLRLPQQDHFLHLPVLRKDLSEHCLLAGLPLQRRHVKGGRWSIDGNRFLRGEPNSLFLYLSKEEL